MQGTQFYENYTGIVLPLQKLDFVAIPGRRGAVENWGLIQFDERRMLFNQVNLHFFSLPTQPGSAWESDVHELG